MGLTVLIMTAMSSSFVLGFMVAKLYYKGEKR
jgi:hypothetical protein